VQLSGSVVWGLSFATLLTLVLTPVLLAAPMVMSARFAALWVRVTGRPAPRRTPVYGDHPKAAE